MFAGLGGLLVVVIVFIVIAIASYWSKKYPTYNLEPGGVQGRFELIQAKYLHLAEFMIGLATGSIVLLVGSSALHGQGGHLPWFYASPLLLLGASVLSGLVFMAWLILMYEEVQHGNPHTRVAYAASETFGFSAIVYFCVGYLWLVVAATK